MGEDTVEYGTLIKLTSELRVAVRLELVSLTGSLLASRLISLDNDIELRNTTHSEVERSARLVELVQIKVRQNPRHYHSFIGILQGNQDQYRDILQRLEHTYQEHEQEDGPQTADPQDMQSHIHDLECRFRSLHEKILSELEDGDISVSKLLSSLTVIPAGIRQEYKTSIKEAFPNIRKETTIREAFYHLSPLLDFLSCSLLKYIIDEFGSNSLKNEMTTYNNNVLEFMKKTTVKQLMDHLSGQYDEVPPNFSKMKAKIDEDPSIYTLYQLDQLRKRYCCELKLTDVVLILIGLEMATSFVVEWLIPSAIVPQLIESAKQLDFGFYHNEHIVQITVDEKQIFLWLPDTKSNDFAHIAAAATIVDNYKSTLQEICQKNGCGLPEYKLECEGGTPDNPHFEVSVTVEWNGEVLVERATATEKKKEVEKMAAKKMVERLSSGITTINPSDGTLCSKELDSWWEHYDLMIQSIEDPNALAEAACRANLIGTDVKDVIVKYGCFSDVQAKTRSLLQIIEGKVKGHSTFFHQFLSVLRNLPRLTKLASCLQASYDGRVVGTLVNSQQTDDCEEDESNESAEECSDNDSEAESSSDMRGGHKEQEHESQADGGHDIDLDQIDSTVLGLEDEQAVREELVTLAAKYESVGITLGLSSSELEVIGHECVRDAKRALGRVIQTWLKQSYNVDRFGLPSWRSLVKAVDSHTGGDNHALAKKIASKYKVRKRNHDGVDDPRTKVPRIDERERLTRRLHTGGAGAVTTPTAQLSVQTTAVQQSPSQMTLTINLDLVIDAENQSFKHLGQIADSMHEWQGRIADELELTPADIAGIKMKQPTELKLQVREALQIWKQRNGSAATYSNLIGVFERAGYQEYAETVRRIALANRKRQQNTYESEPQPKLPCIENGPLVRFRPKLAVFYSKKPEVPEGTWPPVKKTHFVNLALIKQTATNIAKDYVRQTIHGCIDDIIKDKEKISYEDAFSELENGAVVVVEGRPGCGKTTLMHKLSQDWEKGKVLATCLLFLVHFRRFSNRSDVKLPDLLRASTLDFTDEEMEEMCRLIEENSGRGVVFALDGLDEYCPESKDNLFYNLLKGRRLPNCIVIVSSRPAASQRFRKYATKHIEVLGFLKPQIQEYIENYFCEHPDKAQGLLRYLEHHLNVMHMCYLPLHSAMVTYLYDMEGASLPQTEAEIYRHFTLWTLVRSFKKRSADPDAPFIMNDFDDLSHDDKRVFDLILKLAFNATVNSKQVFTLKEVKQCISEQLSSSNSENDENSLGLIVVDRYFVKYGLDEIYTFLHLTFQEFLAACFVANQTELEQTNLLKIHGSKENLAEVWKFYCGSGKCSSENFKLLMDETKTESNRSKKKKDTCISSLLLHLHCAYESQQEEKCHQIMETYDSSIVLDNKSLNPVDMTALGYVITSSNVMLKELAITSCHLGPEGLAAFAAVVGDQKLAIETLNFRGTAIKPDMCNDFVSLLRICPLIKSLNVSKCSVIVKTLSDISNNIPDLEFLTDLDISSNQLGKTGSAVESLLKKMPHLQTVVVHLYKDCQWYVSLKAKDQLKDINVMTFVAQKETQQALATCTELDLSWLNLSTKDVEIIGERLKECSNLTKLNLAGNQIGATGAQAIAEGLKLCPNLQTVVLYNNQIGDAGAQAIADGCKLCPNLQTIDLRWNSITDASVLHLVGLIETARKLEKFYLHSNKFTDAGNSQLRQAAEKRNNDQANYVHLNLVV